MGVVQRGRVKPDAAHLVAGRTSGSPGQTRRRRQEVSTDSTSDEARNKTKRVDLRIPILEVEGEDADRLVVEPRDTPLDARAGELLLPSGDRPREARPRVRS